MGGEMSDTDFLNWLADRLERVYGWSPNVDFIRRLRKIAADLEGK